MLSVRHAQLVCFFCTMSTLWKKCVRSIPNLKYSSKRGRGSERMDLFLSSVLEAVKDPSKMGGVLGEFFARESLDGGVPSSCDDLSMENQVVMMLLAAESAYALWKEMRRISGHDSMQTMKTFMKDARSCFGKTFDSLRTPLKLEAVLLHFRV